MIYLDNAATTSPKPSGVVRAVSDAVRALSANPGRGGHAPSVRAAEAVYAARGSIGVFFGLPIEENVIFTPNCTYSLNTVIKGVLKKGDHAVISPYEHNSVLRPLEKLSRQGIATYTVADDGESDDELIDGFRRAINERTRLMICTHASNVTGRIMPIKRLCALAHSYGILFCVDAAQSAGTLDINMAEDGFDYVCCAGHKGLYGPMGTGLLLINNGLLPDTLVEGGTGTNSHDAIMPDELPERLESGTINVPGIIGLSAGVSFVKNKGRDAIYRSELSKIRYLHRELSAISRVRIFSPFPEYGEYAPVLSFQIDGADSESVAEFLDKRFGIAVRAGLHCAPLAHRSIGTTDGGTVRVSPSVFNTESDIEAVIKGVKNFIRYA